MSTTSEAHSVVSCGLPAHADARHSLPLATGANVQLESCASQRLSEDVEDTLLHPGTSRELLPPPHEIPDMHKASRFPMPCLRNRFQDRSSGGRGVGVIVMHQPTDQEIGAEVFQDTGEG